MCLSEVRTMPCGTSGGMVSSSSASLREIPTSETSRNLFLKVLGRGLSAPNSIKPRLVGLKLLP
jgi:hypothetical protein